MPNLAGQQQPIYCQVRRIHHSTAGFQTCRIADFQIGRAPAARARRSRNGQRVWKPARQQTWKAAVRRVVAYPGDFPVARSADGNTGLESPVNPQVGKPAPQLCGSRRFMGSRREFVRGNLSWNRSAEHRLGSLDTAVRQLAGTVPGAPITRFVIQSAPVGGRVPARTARRETLKSRPGTAILTRCSTR